MNAVQGQVMGKLWERMGTGAPRDVQKVCLPEACGPCVSLSEGAKLSERCAGKLPAGVLCCWGG